MAFNQRKLDKVYNQSRGIFDRWVYRSDEDTIAEITSPGYFDASRFADDPDWKDNPVFIDVLAADGPYEVQLVGGVASVVSVGNAGLGYKQTSGSLLAGITGIEKSDSGVIFIGDSITQGEVSTDGNNDDVSRIYGIHLSLADHLLLLDGYNAGIGGNTSGDVVARLSSLQADMQPIVDIMIGTNDITQEVDADTYISNCKKIIYRVFDYGAKKVVMHFPPTRNAWSAAQLNLWNEYKSRFNELRVDLNVVIDKESYKSVDTTTDYIDGTHLNLKGAISLGAAQAEYLKLVYEQSRTLSGYGESNLLNNYLMTGTAGTTAGISAGDAASGWTIAGNLTATATVVGSKTDNNFGDFTDAQTITVGGTCDQNGRLLQFRQSVTIPAASSSDVYVASFRVRIESGHSGIQMVNAVAQSFYSTNASKRSELPSGEFNEVICTAVNGRFSGGETTIQPQLNLYFEAGEISAVIHIDKPVLRKVN